jgi:hypothetical protein
MTGIPDVSFAVLNTVLSLALADSTYNLLLRIQTHCYKANEMT